MHRVSNLSYKNRPALYACHFLLVIGCASTPSWLQNRTRRVFCWVSGNMAWVHLHNIISEAFSNMWRTPQHSFCSVSSLKHISMCTCFYWSPCPMCFLCCDSFLARSCGLRFFYGTHVHFYLVFWCLHAVAIKHLWLLIAEHTNMLTVILYSVTHFCISVKLHEDPFGLFVWVLYQPFILDWLLNNENNKLIKAHCWG